MYFVLIFLQFFELFLRRKEERKHYSYISIYSIQDIKGTSRVWYDTVCKYAIMYCTQHR